jgi:hypothetical protein
MSAQWKLRQPGNTALNWHTVLTDQYIHTNINARKKKIGRFVEHSRNMSSILNNRISIKQRQKFRNTYC